VKYILTFRVYIYKNNHIANASPEIQK